jgi:hypothetical protein
LRKIFTSLIVLIAVLAFASAAARANSIVLGPSNVHRLHVAINSNGTGTSSWNEFQMQFHGSFFPAGFAVKRGQLTGFGPASWNSTLTLTFAKLPMTGNSFYIDVFQFSNGALLSGASTRLTWNGVRWTTSGLPPTQVPEPSILVLLGITTVVGAFLRKRLV